MFTLLLLAIMFVVLSIITFTVVGTAGAMFLVVFGDGIVGIMVLVWIIKKLRKK